MGIKAIMGSIEFYPREWYKWSYFVFLVYLVYLFIRL
jgi:hypothetical protein